MRFAHVGLTCTSYVPAIGGAQIHSHEIAKRLVRQGASVTVVAAWIRNRTDWLLGTTIRAPDVGQKRVEDGISVIQPGLSSFERYSLLPGAVLYPVLPEVASPYMARVWRRKIQALPEKTQIIHNVRIGREHLTEASLDVARERGIPFVLTPNHSPRMNRLVSRRLFQLYRKADLLFALTHTEKRQLIRLGVSPDHIRVIGVGPILAKDAEPEAFKRNHRIQGRMVLFLGQKFRYKGYETLLAAAPLVWQRFPDTYFVFIGPTYPYFERVFRRYRDERLVSIGPLSPFSKEKASALAGCDIFCLPTRQDGLGGVFVEAWCFKKPVIGGDIPPLRDVVQDGVDGFLVSQDPLVLARRLNALLESRDLTQGMGEKGFRKVQRLYRWETIVASVHEGYEKARRNLAA